MKHRFAFLGIVLWSCISIAQQPVQEVLSLSEYLGYVKKYHPLVKQANLIIAEGEAKLMKARGGFDPKLTLDYDTKNFKGSPYYDKLNAAFKVPTWYGISLKAEVASNSGVYLNPEATVPRNGLYSMGVSVSLGKGLWMNARMASLQQAKYYTQQAKVDRQLAVTKVLHNALLAYFNWLKTYRTQEVYRDYLNNAIMRWEGVRKSYAVGDKPAIDTLEAKITVTQRKLNLEKASMNFRKASLALSNYLWLAASVPVELQPQMIPDLSTLPAMTAQLQAFAPKDSTFTASHAKVQSLRYKLERLQVDRRLKVNNLLPSIDVSYNFLSPKAFEFSTFNTSNYKAAVGIRIPLFLRKERGELQLVRAKLQATSFELAATQVTIRNKGKVLTAQARSYTKQQRLTEELVQAYTRMVNAEQRKFSLGESSLFLINSREAKLIATELKAITIENQHLAIKAALFQLYTNSLL